MPINREDPYLFRPNTTEAIVPVHKNSIRDSGDPDQIAQRMTKSHNSDGSEFHKAGASTRGNTVPLQQVSRGCCAPNGRDAQLLPTFARLALPPPPAASTPCRTRPCRAAAVHGGARCPRRCLAFAATAAAGGGSFMGF